MKLSGKLLIAFAAASVALIALACAAIAWIR
jgi:hypothetical protein